jgi:hypothetical protein
MSPPRTIGQYRITERLATGGAGEVYAGIDTKIGREVAIKFLRPELASDPSFVDRFLAEAKSLGRLNHPNIATLYELPQEDDHVCMIMELVRGRTVEQIIQDRHGPLGTRESLAILAQVADGLSYAHEQGVIHRDIKPSNLMVTESGRVKIMDFGIARVRGSDRMTRAGSAVGTPLYMSPEQCLGVEGDERSDIYSLAVVLYELLAGAPPFKGTTDFELTKAHIGKPPPPLIPRIAGVEPPLESAIMTALSKRPEQRFPSIRSFSDATGATALRGDATGIVQSYIRPAQGRGATHEPPKRAPLHTVVLAVLRSRAATVARRFRGLHPAVQGVSVGVLAMAIVAAVLLRPESGPVTDNPKPSPSASSSAADGKQGGTLPKQLDNGQAHQIKEAAVVEPAPPKSPPGKSCISGQYFTNNGEQECVPFGLAQEQQRLADERNPPPQRAASKNQEFEKPTLAVFEQAEKQGNYAAALNIAKKLDADGDPAGAYGLGLLYSHGHGVETNFIKARNLFLEAAMPDKGKGYPMAMVKLGVMYHDGIGGEQNFREARKWFEQAAEDDIGEAMWNLGSMSEHNEAGLSRRGAADFYHKALAAGYHPPKQSLDKLGE